MNAKRILEPNAVLKSFSDVQKRTIRIKFSKWNQMDDSLWKSERVKMVLKELEQNGGPLILIPLLGRRGCVIPSADPLYAPINFMV